MNGAESPQSLGAGAAKTIESASMPNLSVNAGDIFLTKISKTAKSGTILYNIFVVNRRQPVFANA